jgi:hypothetical protein
MVNNFSPWIPPCTNTNTSGLNNFPCHCEPEALHHVVQGEGRGNLIGLLHFVRNDPSLFMATYLRH